MSRKVFEGSPQEKIKLLEEQNKQLETQLTSTQIALCDVYELLVNIPVVNTTEGGNL